MGLDTIRVSETKKPTEGIKTEYSFDDMKRLIDSLPTNDVDQQWVKDNEGKEFSFSSQNNNQSVQGTLEQMDKIGSFGKEKTLDSKTQSSTNEWDKLEKIIHGSKPSMSEIMNQQAAIDETSSVKYSDVDSSVLPTGVEHMSQNAELIEELNTRIDKKYNKLVSELSNLYNSDVISQEASSISGDLQSLMDIKDRSLEELTKVDVALDNLISRFAKLAQRADEIKTADDFRINQQQKQLNFLRDYQTQLESNYGKYWFGKMTDQEKENYITLYTQAHKVPRKVVERQIEESIEIAYDEIVSSTNQSSGQVQSASTLQDSQSQPEEQFSGDYENIIKFNVKQAVETLKQIYSGLESATPEQVEDFNFLYHSLSSLSKVKPTSNEEEQQKLTQLYDLTDKINQLHSGMSNSNGESR